MSYTLGVDWGDLKHFTGTIDLGYNNTGVVQTKLHFTGDEIISEDVMSGEMVDHVIDHVDQMRDRQRQGRPGGDWVGSIPLPLWTAWRKEWQRGPKLHGVRWRAFFTTKFMHSDYSKFRAGNI